MEQIDLHKSIQTRKLNFHDGSFWRLTERGLYYFGATMLIYISTKDIWDGLTTDNLPISRIVVDLIIVAIAIWLIYSLVYLDKLSVIKGTDKEKNRSLMYDLMTGMFTDTGFFFIDDQLLGICQWTMKRPGKEIIIIFNDSDILINITHKVRFGADSPFHVLANQADIREIRKKVSGK